MLDVIWTPEIVDDLLSLMESNPSISYLDLAAELESRHNRVFTKGSIAGKIKRLRMTNSDREQALKPRRKAGRPRKVKPTHPSLTDAVKEHVLVQIPLEDDWEPEPEPEPEGPITMLTRRFDQCCYPLWDNAQRSAADSPVCGRQVVASGKSYCLEHYLATSQKVRA